MSTLAKPVEYSTGFFLLRCNIRKPVQSGALRYPLVQRVSLQVMSEGSFQAQIASDEAVFAANTTQNPLSQGVLCRSLLIICDVCLWRKRRNSNPRYGCPYTTFPMWLVMTTSIRFHVYSLDIIKEDCHKVNKNFTHRPHRPPPDANPAKRFAEERRNDGASEVAPQA